MKNKRKKTLVSPPPCHPPHLHPSVVSCVNTCDPPCKQWLTGEGQVLAMLAVANLVLCLVLAPAWSATEIEVKRKNAPMAQETLMSPGPSFLLPSPHICHLTSPLPSPCLASSLPSPLIFILVSSHVQAPTIHPVSSGLQARGRCWPCWQ
jgi:hypothetical protein